jgi:hypothetical protein
MSPRPRLRHTLIRFCQNTSTHHQQALRRRERCPGIIQPDGQLEITMNRLSAIAVRRPSCLDVYIQAVDFKAAEVVAAKIIQSDQRKRLLPRERG